MPIRWILIITSFRTNFFIGYFINWSIFSKTQYFEQEGVLITAIGCVCGIFVGAAIGFLAFMHGYHIMLNLTTIEMHITDPKVLFI